MKVIQVNASYKPAYIYGGPTMSVSKLCEVLTEFGIQLEVVTTSANGGQELTVKTSRPILVNNVIVTYYKRLTKDHTHFSPGLYRGLWMRILKKRWKRENKQDPATNDLIVHIHTWWNFVSIISCLIAICNKVNVVLSPRGTLSAYSFGNKNNFIKNIIFKLSLPLLNRCHFHVTSENERKAILALVNPRSIRTIPNLVSLPNTQSKRDENQEGKDTGKTEAFKILFLSRIEEKKGLELLFSALSSIDLSYQLTIAGSGELNYVERLKKLAQTLNITECISWIGQQSAGEKFDIMANHDLMVLPSYDENFANVVIESLASGTSVLVTQNVGLSDYVTELDLGWVCKFDKTDLRHNIVEASLDKKKRNRIREEAPGIIRKDFSDSVLAEKYIEMYRRIIETSNPHPANPSPF